METLERKVWRAYVGYHAVTFVIFAYLGWLLAWVVSALLAAAVTLGILYYEHRTCKYL